MIKTTTWRPDTCECIIQYEWDSTTTETERVHTPANSVVCKAHKAHENNHKKAFDTVLGENVKKNQTLNFILEQFPEMKQNHEKDPDRPPAYWFKEGFEPEWEFSKTRKLVVRLPKLTNEQKSTLKNSSALAEVEVI